MLKATSMLTVVQQLSTKSLNRCLLIILADDPTVIKCAYIDTFSAVTIKKRIFLVWIHPSNQFYFPLAEADAIHSPLNISIQFFSWPCLPVIFLME